MNNGTESEVTISLDPGVVNAVNCSMCGRHFVHYMLWVSHPCAMFTEAMPVTPRTTDAVARNEESTHAVHAR